MTPLLRAIQALESCVSDVLFCVVILLEAKDLD